jgi:hypothetical protein
MLGDYGALSVAITEVFAGYLPWGKRRELIRAVSLTMVAPIVFCSSPSGRSSTVSPAALSNKNWFINTLGEGRRLEGDRSSKRRRATPKRGSENLFRERLFMLVGGFAASAGFVCPISG